MRHEVLKERDSFDMVDVAAVWPTSAQVAPLPIPEIEPAAERAPVYGAPAAPDVPVAVGGLIVAAYVSLIATFAVATVASRESIFMIVVAGFFLFMFFAVPRLFFKYEADHGVRQSFSRFMSEGMQTFTGHSAGGAALVQMLIVPVFLTLGVVAMGIAAALIF
ncbi:hypothetical protein [Sphingosinicella humi]|uniref:Uncharacterized protein n=1 Tax=Allosphingosinicella humi TaxID=2068657 RepID=A0A2U2J0B2_9SPHN|nr:hypothetical protein [Sphingosinicella humi]PWG01721.1 hypothetical protein DF286_01690 [Sphingosinicella humi]